MKVLCAYANLHPATERALRTLVPSAWLTLVDISGNATGYWEEIGKLWTGEDDLVIVEQDIEIHEAVLRSFVECSAPWCSFSYEFRETGWSIHLKEGLGCTKFSAELQRSLNLSLVLGSHHWIDLDTHLAYAIKKNARAYAHIHGQVQHHHQDNHAPGQECETCRVCNLKSGDDASHLLLRLPPPPQSTGSPGAIRPGH